MSTHKRYARCVFPVHFGPFDAKMVTVEFDRETGRFEFLYDDRQFEPPAYHKEYDNDDEQNSVPYIVQRKFQRHDHFTGEPITDSGWVFEGGLYYAKTKESADRIAREIYGYEDMEDLYASGDPENTTDCDWAYWTEWPEDDWFE